MLWNKVWTLIGGAVIGATIAALIAALLLLLGMTLTGNWQLVSEQSEPVLKASAFLGAMFGTCVAYQENR